MSGAWFRLLVTALYVVLATVYVYAWEHQPEPDYSHEPENAVDLIVPISFLALHFATGLAVGRLWVLALALVPFLVAIPAGEYPGGWPEVPVWLVMLTQGFAFFLPCLAAGLVVRLLFERRRQKRGRSPQPA
jgi:hypothetical protein